MVLAEAGLSECARDAACSAGFDRPLHIAGLLVVAALWLYICLHATVVVERRRLMPRAQRRWIAVIWLVPFVGSAAWFCLNGTARADARARSDGPDR